MIGGRETLSIAEISEYVDKDSNTDIIGFAKKFSKLKLNDAKELRKKLKEMDMMKMNDKHITKIIDLMPETSEELNKIFTDLGLNEDETTKILNTIRESK